MTGLLSTINISLSAILANQRAIDVVNHNVANVNTEGYRRQGIVFKSGVPASSSQIGFGSTTAGMFGTGVLIDRIERFSIDFLDKRYRTEISETKRYEIKGEILSNVEATLAEMDAGGLLTKLDNFWDSWQVLSGDPTNLALRSAVREAGRNLAEAFTNRMNSLDEMYANQEINLQNLVLEINEKAQEVARLNIEIAHRLGSGEAPNDLMDKRDLLLDRLAEVAGATYATMDNGETIVSIGGHILVYGRSTEPLTYDQSTNTIIWQDGQTAKITSGQIAGIEEARTVILSQQNGLNEIAAGVINWVNDIHQTQHQVVSVSGPLSGGFITLGGDGTGPAASITSDPDSVLASVSDSAVAPGSRELGSGNYTLETRTNGGVNQFRLLDADGNTIVNWSAIPQAPPSDSYDTQRGLTLTFSNPAVVGQTVTLSYMARGYDITINPGESLNEVADRINASLYNQPEGSEVTASVADGMLILTPLIPGANHRIYLDASSAPSEMTFATGLIGPRFFNGSDARTIRLSEEVKASLDNIIASKAVPYAPGDGSIAQALADGRTATNFLIGSELTNANSAYNLQITELGLEINHAVGSMHDRSVVAAAIEEQRTSFTGVSLDEEAINLMRYQKAFEASARVITIVDEMLRTLLGMAS